MSSLTNKENSDRQRTSQHPHNLENRPIQFEGVFEDVDKEVCDDSDLDLYSYGNLDFIIETCDSEVLLDSFEEKLNLPALFAE